MGEGGLAGGKRADPWGEAARGGVAASAGRPRRTGRVGDRIAATIDPGPVVVVRGAGREIHRLATLHGQDQRYDLQAHSTI